MTEQATSEFKVDEIVIEQGDIWLEDRDEERTGLLVAVELDADYDDSLREQLDELTEGDTITATLESQNSLNTIWHFLEVNVERESVQRRDPSEAPA
jgi:hypothetical protein